AAQQPQAPEAVPDVVSPVEAEVIDLDSDEATVTTGMMGTREGPDGDQGKRAQTSTTSAEMVHTALLD
ncbi:unnamed protein product, partial [Durusdinium trenchii]